MTWRTLVAMRFVLVAGGFVAALGCACVQTTNRPNEFGKSVEQPPAQKIARTPKQWCVDYCARVRGCFEQNPDSKHASADEAFATCKREHHGCEITEKDAILCCAELVSCGDFRACAKQGAPAGC